MKILSDTTYLLPAIGVSVRGLPRTAISKLRKQGHKLMISNITIFELAAKGAKLTTANRLSMGRVTEGLKAILHDPDIETVQFTDLDILSRASSIRAEIHDFINCLILSSAAAKADILLTEDEKLQDLALDDGILSRLKPPNPDFRVHGLRRLT